MIILQFGKVPPPIGGVSIHIKRLMDGLKSFSIKTELLDYSKDRNIISIIRKISRCKIVHFHLTNKKLRLLFILIFRMVSKKVIVTFHGKYDFSNKYDYYSLRYATKSILLNKATFENARKTNIKSIQLIGAFIPPKLNTVSSLRVDTINKIKLLKEKYDYVFCTNAWNVVLNNQGKEIYNGSLLCEIFKNTNTAALVFSDPLGKYSEFLKKKYGFLPDNIFFITYNHDFFEVINFTDALLRATITDGDSLSINEALYFNKDVITSDVVDRPSGCILYKSTDDFVEIINNFSNFKGKYKKSIYINNITCLKALYIETIEGL